MKITLHILSAYSLFLTACLSQETAIFIDTTPDASSDAAIRMDVAKPTDATFVSEDSSLSDAESALTDALVSDANLSDAASITDALLEASSQDASNPSDAAPDATADASSSSGEAGSDACVPIPESMACSGKCNVCVSDGCGGGYCCSCAAGKVCCPDGKCATSSGMCLAISIN